MKRWACLGFLPFLLVASAFVFFSNSCRLFKFYRLERKLDPVNTEFFSDVRYIITGEEKKIFLELPSSEKEAFRENFWKIRDPNPDTEENEFKVMYYDRIETANDLFISEGRPGWLTDRGRIFVLFGPPWERITYPMGSNPASRCREIWYYGNFPVVFIDATCTGHYKLITYAMSEIREYNLMYMHEFSKAQERSLEAPEKAREYFDFSWRVKINTITENKAEGVIRINIPYKDIWFDAENDLLKTILDVRLELKNSDSNIIWEHEEAFPITIKVDEPGGIKGKKYKIEIPFILNKDISRLRQEKILLYAVVRNRSGNDEAKKVMELRL